VGISYDKLDLSAVPDPTTFVHLVSRNLSAPQRFSADGCLRPAHGIEETDFYRGWLLSEASKRSEDKQNT
jgi:hypothetical protein